MNLHDARETVETMLEIVSMESRADSNLILWHDPKELNRIPDSLAEQDDMWARIDAAIKDLDAAGWLQYRGELITVVPTDGKRGAEQAAACEAVEAVAYLLIDDSCADEHGDWDIEPIAPACDRLATLGAGKYRLMTVAQHERIVKQLTGERGDA